MLKNFIKAAIAASVLATGAANVMTVQATSTYNGNTYQLLSEAGWTYSEAYAVSLGGHLVAVDNDAVARSVPHCSQCADLCLDQWPGGYVHRLCQRRTQ